MRPWPREQLERNLSNAQWEFDKELVEERRRLEQEIDAKRERTGTLDPTELERRLEEWTEAHRPDPDKLDAKMRGSGQGEYDLDDAKSRETYFDAIAVVEPEPVEPLAEDADQDELEDYIDARMNGSAVDTEETED